MFETEAEEYYESKPVHTYVDSLGFFHDLEGIKQAYIQGRIDERKANEWHYVKDELPPIKKEYNGRSEPVLVLSKEKEMQYAQYVEKEKTWARGICEINFKPYAWKEIVLPELKESE